MRAYLPFIIGGSAIALVIAIYWTGHRAGASSVQVKWEEEKAVHASALLAQEAEHRAKEKHLNETMEAIQDEGREKLTELAGVLSGVAAERDSLHSALADSRERASQDSTTTGSCAPIQSAADLYSELLRELQGLAGDYAAAADRARLAGDACVVAYREVRGPK